jgi:hypothetical protein
MNMIFDAANDDWLAIEVRQDSAEIVMHFITNFCIAQEWTPLFSGEHRVDQNLCE